MSNNTQNLKKRNPQAQRKTTGDCPKRRVRGQNRRHADATKNVFGWAGHTHPPRIAKALLAIQHSRNAKTRQEAALSALDEAHREEAVWAATYRSAEGNHGSDVFADMHWGAAYAAMEELTAAARYS